MCSFVGSIGLFALRVRPTDKESLVFNLLGV